MKWLVFAVILTGCEFEGSDGVIKSARQKEFDKKFNRYESDEVVCFVRNLSNDSLWCYKKLQEGEEQ